MSNLDQPNSGKIFGNDGPQKLNAADFEIYAPRALAIADMHGEGIATKAEIQHMVAQPAPAEDAKTKESMKFLLDHYDFLHQMSHPVDVVYGKESDTTMPGEDRNLIQTKQGITPDAIGKVNDVLEGKRAPGRDQINFSDSDPMKWPLILGGIPATTISGWGLGTMAGAAMETGATAAGLAVCTIGTLGAGLAAGAVVAYVAYEYEQHGYANTWRNQTKGQYNAFLQDIEGTEKIRQKFLRPES